MARARITPEDVARDYQGRSDLKKNLKQLLDLRERLRKRGPYGVRSLRRRLNRDIRLLTDRAGLVSWVTFVHDDVPIRVNSYLNTFEFINFYPLPFGCLPRWAQLVREDPKRWIIHCFGKDREGFAARYRTKKAAIKVASEFIASGVIPEELK